jgi:hypothetical protein
MYWARYGVGTTVAVLLASPLILLAGGVVALAVVFGLIAVLVLAVTFAPALPGLHRLPVVGESRVEVIPTFEGPGLTAKALRDGDVILRVGFVNHGPQRVRDTLVNVVVSRGVEIEASDHHGKPEARGSLGPPTELDGEPANFWIDKDVALVVGATLRHYRLWVPASNELPRRVKVRVAYSSDDLYGKEDRVCVTQQAVTHDQQPDDL